MTRLTLANLKQEALTLLPDNTTGLISPADLRNVLNNTIDSLNTVVAMSYGQPNVAMAVTAAVIRLPASFFTAVFNDDPGVLEGRASTFGDLITHSNVGQLQLDFNVAFSGGNNIEYHFYFMRNGAPLPPVFHETAQGATNPITVSGSWLISNPNTNDSFTIGISTPDGNSSPTITGCAIKGAMYPSAT